MASSLFSLAKNLIIPKLENFGETAEVFTEDDMPLGYTNTDNDNDPNEQLDQGNLENTEQISILQINVEGLSMAKRTYLERMSKEHKVNILCLQETHIPKGAPPDRFKIQGFQLTCHDDHPKYGTAIYIREDTSPYTIIPPSNINDISFIGINVRGISIFNTYKPPNTSWAHGSLPTIPKPSVVLGDFNSHNTLWGYDTTDEAGEPLEEWFGSQDLYLIQDLKGPKTFWSARLNSGYNPDLTLVSLDNDGIPYPTERTVIGDFPNSQHRLILTKLGATIPYHKSLQIPRWNFRKSNWQGFQKYIEEIVNRIPKAHNSIDRFTGLLIKAAKLNIPRGYRKSYIAGWDENSEELFVKYKQNPTAELGRSLLASLNEKKKRKWIDTIESLDMKKNSREAWKLLHRLEGKYVPSISPLVKSQTISSALVGNSRIKIDKTHAKRIKKDLQHLAATCQPHPVLTERFSIDDVSNAINDLKIGKAPGKDKIHPEFLHNLGPKARLWLANVLFEIFVTGNIPRAWKTANIIALLKPGKPADNPNSYRPVALLSVLSKLMERIILKKISPVIEPHIPIHQTGFRPNRSCCDQVLALTSHIEKGYVHRRWA
ncbi:hypothetical protein QTP88_021224 [Uroleucon formosanum]